MSDANSVRIQQKRKSRSLSWATWFVIVVNVVLLSSLGLARLYYGSFKNAVMNLRGEPLGVDSRSKSFANGHPGDTVIVPFYLTNHGAKSVEILGFRATCSCTVAEDVPFTIPPGSNKELRARIILSEHDVRAPVEVKMVLFTDIPNQHELALSIHGTVTTLSRDVGLEQSASLQPIQ